MSKSSGARKQQLPIRHVLNRICLILSSASLRRARKEQLPTRTWYILGGMMIINWNNPFCLRKSLLSPSQRSILKQFSFFNVELNLYLLFSHLNRVLEIHTYCYLTTHHKVLHERYHLQKLCGQQSLISTTTYVVLPLKSIVIISLSASQMAWPVRLGCCRIQ